MVIYNVRCKTTGLVIADGEAYNIELAKKICELAVDHYDGVRVQVDIEDELGCEKISYIFKP